MTEIGQALVKKVREIVSESPDFVYQPPGPDEYCVYIIDSQPSCLIGRALWAVNLINESLPPFNNKQTIQDLVGSWKWDIAPEEVEWLSYMQSRQDLGHSWGKSLAMTDKKNALYA